MVAEVRGRGRETNLSIFFLFSFNREKVLEMCSMNFYVFILCAIGLFTQVHGYNCPLADNECEIVCITGLSSYGFSGSSWSSTTTNGNVVNSCKCLGQTGYENINYATFGCSV